MGVFLVLILQIALIPRFFTTAKIVQTVLGPLICGTESTYSLMNSSPKKSMRSG